MQIKPAPVDDQLKHAAQAHDDITCSHGDNRQFLPQLFQDVNKMFSSMSGKHFTIDVCSMNNGINALCPKWLSPNRSFLKEYDSLAGQALWINPPFRQINTFLQHYLHVKKLQPQTCGAVLLPAWYNAAWRPLLRGFKCVKTFAVGSEIFMDPCNGKLIKGIPWPVEIWVDLPHHPITLATSSDADKPPSMTFKGLVNGAKCDYLIDSGASECFYDLNRAKLLGLKLIPTLRTIQVADGHNVLCNFKCQINVRIQQYTATVWVNLLDLGTENQVILGDDWLRHAKATLDYNMMQCIVHTPSRVHTLTVQTPPVKHTPKLLLTAVQLKRHIDDGGEFCTVNVVDDGISPVMQANSSNPVPWMENMPPCSDKMKAQILEFSDVFEPIKGMPPARESTMQHSIELEPNTKPHFRPMRRYSPLELKAINDLVADLLAKGLIEPSNSPWGAAIVLATKKDGSVRPCVDWRVLNSKTKRDSFPLPLQEQLFDYLSGSQYFSSLDLQSGYFQLAIHEADREKTAFRTPFGHYQFKVLGQGLTNSPAVFMRTMTKLFAKQLGVSVLVYLDDILVFSKTAEDHIRHVREVLQILRDSAFYAKLSKCEFEQEELKFLGHIIGRHGIRPDPQKTAAVDNWPKPTSVTEVRSFLGLANYFRKFIQGFSKLAAPLTALTKLNADIDSWDAACDKSFAGVKRALMTAPTLALPDFSKPFELISDASITGIGSVLIQEGHPLAYLSKKLSPAEVNYTTTEQELLAVILALQEWRCYLEGATHPFTIVSDHHPLTHLQTQPNVSRRQARWVEMLQRYNWIWEYRPGRINVADPLSRIPHIPLNRLHIHLRAMITRNRGATKVKDPELPPPPPKRRKVSKEAVPHDVPLAQAPPIQGTDPLTPQGPIGLLPQLTAAYEQDPWFAVSSNTTNLRLKDGIWWRGSHIAIPNDHSLKQGILYELHDAPYSGHPGRDKTVEAVQRLYWWPNMVKDIKQYVASCPNCQRNKSTNKVPPGLLQPLPVPENPWDSVSMDFITQLPTTTTGFDSILVVVCRLTKMVHIIPTTTKCGALGLATLYRDHVWKLHGVPKDVVSDRGREFHNAFMAELYRLIGTEQKLSTAYHPQTDGQTERVNRVLEDMLRNYVGGKQDDWDQYLSSAEFAINNSRHDSTGTTPFKLCNGRDPNLPVTVAKGNVPSAATFADKMKKGLAEAKLCIEAARQRQKAYADTKRRHVEYAVGDNVLLSSKNINLRMPQGGTKKLLPRWIGPFTIIKKINDVAYRVALPDNMKRVHDVFHVSLLKKHVTDGRTAPPPPPIEVDGEQYFHIERILDHRFIKGGKKGNRARPEYLIRWEGYSAEHDTWEPENNIAASELGETLRKYWEYTGLEPQPGTPTATP